MPIPPSTQWPGNILSLSAFVFVSVFMVFAGYVPGYYKERYKEKIESVF